MEQELVAWRDEDERVLARLEDEAASATLWRAQAPVGAPAPPRGAWALAAAARVLADGVRAVAAAARGDSRDLRELLLVASYAGKPGPFLHASAVYFDRLASAYEETPGPDRTGQAQQEEAGAAARTRSMAAWLSLAEEATYLDALGRRLAHGAAEPSEAAHMARAAALAFFGDLAARARSGAAELDASGGRALATLERVGDACKLAGLESASTRTYLARAERERASAIDAALAPAMDEIMDLKAREDGAESAWPAFERVRQVWEWSGRDQAVEQFAIDQITDFAWDLYKKSRWTDLSALLAPAVPLFESLEQRILRDPVGQLAYAAGCAQTLVFRSDVEKNASREWAYAERALALCPSHRNGRQTMAHLCCHRALRTLQEATFLTAAADIAGAAVLLERAAALFPDCRALPGAKAALEAARVRWKVPA